MATIPEILQCTEHEVDRAQVAVVIPTCNARAHWAGLKDALNAQGLAAGQILIVDSSSDDGTAALALAEGYQVFRIDRCDFDHGGTRRLALDLVPWAKIVVYLTQDAILAAPDTLDRLLSAFANPEVAAAYGRQLPRPQAGPIESHARLFNYPAQSAVRSFESRHTVGIKAAFLSNSFAAYRTKELRDAGGFPAHVIMAEDAIAAGKLLLAGRKTAYVAEAQVYHSHPFTVTEEFRRYFDIGVCHRLESWLPGRFGRPGSEGARYFMSELKYLAGRSPWLIPAALVRTFSKALAYQLGLHGSWLGQTWSRRVSYHRSFWNQAPGKTAKSISAQTNSTVGTPNRITLH